MNTVITNLSLLKSARLSLNSIQYNERRREQRKIYGVSKSTREQREEVREILPGFSDKTQSDFIYLPTTNLISS